MINLFIDTSTLHKAGVSFKNPDFQKILRYAKDKHVKIFIPHIVMEERRTQLVQEALSSINKLNFAINELNISFNVLFKHISLPLPYELDAEDIKNASQKVMQDIVNEHSIEVIPITLDHAQKTWANYFELQPPFNSQLQLTHRENNRKHIPDAWIFEAAMEVKIRHSDLVVLIDDKNLRECLAYRELRTVSNFEEAIKLIESFIASTTAPDISVTAPTLVTTTEKNELQEILSQANTQFQSIEIKVLGFIAYLSPAPKIEIMDLLSKTGISLEKLENAAHRLVLNGMVTDTGNNYLLSNKIAGNIAASEVESEIISLMDQI